MTSQGEVPPVASASTAATFQPRILAFIHGLAEGPDGADRGPLEPDTPLLDLGLIDSFNIVEIAAFLEETFEIQVPSDQLLRENFRSVQAISRLVVASLAVRQL